MSSRSSKTGFTLIELLVVVFLIALLLAIVIPSLFKAQGRVQTVTCQSNLKQWGIYLVIYSNDNEGYLPSDSRDWMTILLPYSEMAPSAADSKAQNDTGSKSISCCPTASQPGSNPPSDSGQPFAAFPIQYPHSSETVALGSYGINGWVCHVPSSEKEIYGIPTTKNWRRFDVGESASKIPLVLDSMWIRAFLDNTNLPPEKNGDFNNCDLTGGGARQMRHFAIARHSGRTNILFLDLGVHQTGLKNLWKMKWHRGSDTNAPEPEWPEWMQALPE
ncbi:MAG TPA: prepilin-type N-terminal cleavage/methylation domain-containing protein [Anaerohalosphaeraceae bacterium]|nr:prepilin-type N-terminal cleavage/methylation domain-containing protein [Anaerohalosphaeraceae bacterium]